MSKGAVVDLAIRTLDQKGRGNPFDPANYGEIVKPGELVDIVELNPLTLADRRIYNLLIANAWDRIGEPVIHRIAKSALKGTHQGNERIESSLLRLMGTIAIVTIRKGNKSFKRRVQLLAPADIERRFRLADHRRRETVVCTVKHRDPQGEQLVADTNQ